MVNTEKSKPDSGLLQEMYGTNDVFKALFDQLAAREKNSRATKTDRMLKLLYDLGRSADRREVIQFFRGLERAGCGRYVEGRRGHPSRFEWTARLSSVGLVAAGKQAKVQPLGEEEFSFTFDDIDEQPLMQPTMPLSSTDGIAESVGDVRHPFRLRPDKTVSLVLPNDLTPQEAQRLSDFVKTLPLSV